MAGLLAPMMSGLAVLAAVVVGVGVVSCLGTYLLIGMLRRAAMLDRPNKRSLHERPIPRGGGIAVVSAIVLGWLALIAIGAVPWLLTAALLGAVLLAGVSWLDDLYDVPPLARLAVQFVAVLFGLLAITPARAMFQGWLPIWLDLPLTAVVWLWFVNLFNFMDGSDGLAGSEAVMIGIGLALFALTGAGDDPGLAALAAMIAAAALGFLVWNWAPARIFLGDVGSVPLGYLLGFLLLLVASRGHWRIALILPLYFLVDATVTLLRRLLRGERVWQAHREHFYQRAVQRGLGHAYVAMRVIAADLALVGCGWAAENGFGASAVAAAGAVVLLLLASLAGMPPRQSG